MTNEEYFDDDEFREMLAEYEQQISEGMPVFFDIEDLADIADYYQMKRRFDDAQQAIDLILEREPESIIALNFKVHGALDKEDYEAAEEALALMDDHESAEYIYCRAEIWIAKGQTDKADEFLRHCLKTIPQEEYRDYVLDVANLWSDYNNDEKSLEWLMRALPDDTEDFKELLARTYFGLGDYEVSERLFNELIDRNPFQKRYWNALANTQYMKEDYGASVTSSEYAIAIDPDDEEGILAKANALFRLGNYAEAQKYYERYSEKEPDDEFCMMYQGCCLINLSRFEEAIDRFERALSLAPEDSPYLGEIYQEMAYACCENDRLDLALQYLDETENINCNHAEMEIMRGHFLLSSKRIEESTEAFTKALSIAKKDEYETLLLRIIVSFYDNQYLEQSYAMFKSFFELTKPERTEGYSYMALCCYDLKRFDEYLEYLKEACKRNPHEAGIVLRHLFPEDMKPEEYVEYAKKKQKQ